MKFTIFLGLVQADFNESCNALEEAQYCEQFCYEELKLCLEECIQNGDMNCQPECLRESATCDEQCPCNTNCVEGLSLQ